MKLYLGIDGGQTEMRGLLADEFGRILGFGRGGPCQHLNQERTRRAVQETIRHVVHDALASAGFSDRAEIQSAFLGITGITNPRSTVARFYRSALTGSFNTRQVVTDIDARNALAGAIPSQAGVVVIAGTGSIAFGANEAGEEARAGGWGYLIGDPGSGFEIGRQAVLAVLRQHELRGPRTLITPMLLQELGIEDVALVPQFIHQKDPPKGTIAGISILVNQAAQQGDPVALQILTTAGQDLAELAQVVLRKLDWKEHRIPVSGTGGVLGSSQTLWAVFQQEVLKREARSLVVPPRYPPLVGALLLAYSHDGVPVEPNRIQFLREGDPLKDFLAHATRN